MLLSGRALPNDALVRRPDLLEAKLHGRLVPAPTAAVRVAEAALHAVAGGQEELEAPQGPPAA